MYKLYVPQGQNGPDLLASLGLEDLCLDGVLGAVTPIINGGPDGGGGLLIEFGRPNGQSRDRTWDPCWPDPIRNLPAGRFWWGFPNATLTPEVLRTGTMVPGEPVDGKPAEKKWQPRVPGSWCKMGDGNIWLLPNMPALPHRYTGDPLTGKIISEVHPDWSKLYNRLEWAFNLCVSGLSDAELPEEECWAYLCEMLSLNYRVNRELILRLRLLDGKWWNPFAASTDLVRLRKIEKDLLEKKVA